MNKPIFNVFFIILITLIAGCENVDVSKVSDKDLERISDKAVICNSPYIRVGIECCLDQNNNKICDKDETGTAKKKIEEKPVETTEIAKIQTKQQSGQIIKIFEDDTINDFDIWGDKIVFLGGGNKYEWAVYLYDIPTKELKRITYDSSSKRTPLIYNDLIFWNDERFVDNNIFM